MKAGVTDRSRSGLVLCFCSAVLFLVPTPSPAGHGDCLQPATTGAKATVRDCLHVLKSAVQGVVACQPACICDADGDEDLTASDALMCLHHVVGRTTPALCAACPEPLPPLHAVSRGVVQIPDDDWSICPTELALSVILAENGKGWVSLESPSIVPHVVEVSWEEKQGAAVVDAPDVLVSGWFRDDPHYVVDVGWLDLRVDLTDSDQDGIVDTGSGSVTVFCQFFGAHVYVDDSWDLEFELAPDAEEPTLDLPGGRLLPLYAFEDVTVLASRPLLRSTLSGLALTIDAQPVAAKIRGTGVVGPFATGAEIAPKQPLEFGSTVMATADGVTDVLGRTAVFGDDSFETASDPAPITANPGFEGDNGWINLDVRDEAYDFQPVEGEQLAFVGHPFGTLIGYLDVPGDATLLRFRAGKNEHLQCGSSAEVVLRSSQGTRRLFPPKDAPTEPCDGCISGSRIPWMEVTADIQSLQGQRVVLEARASKYSACLPDVYEELVLDDFRIE